MYNVGVASYHHTIDGVSRYKQEVAGNSWHIRYVDMYAQYEMNILESLGLDGFITDIKSSDVAMRFRDAGIQLVNVGTTQVAEADWVTTDDAAIGRMAAEYMLNQPGNRFYLAAYSNSILSAPRLMACRETLLQHGHDAQIINCQPRSRHNIIEGNSYDPAGLSQRLGGLQCPAFVFANNDALAFEVLGACLMAGLRIPEDVAIIGVDNAPLFCHLATPELSSIDPDFNRNGFEAARRLDQLMRGEIGGGPIKIEPVGIVERGSSDRGFLQYPAVRQALSFIRLNFNDGITVADVVAHVPLSRRPLELQFKHALGRTILDIINDVRTDWATELLRTTSWPIDRVAYQAGFPNPKSLQNQFKRRHGITAAEFRTRSATSGG